MVKESTSLLAGQSAMGKQPNNPPYEIEFYEDENGEKPCLKWIKEELSKTKRRALGAAMFEILQEQGTGVVGSKSWGRQLGDGVVEFRLDRTVKSVVGKTKDGKPRTVTEQMVLRVFFHGFW